MTKLLANLVLWLASKPAVKQELKTGSAHNLVGRLLARCNHGLQGWYHVTYFSNRVEIEIAMKPQAGWFLQTFTQELGRDPFPPDWHWDDITCCLTIFLN